MTYTKILRSQDLRKLRNHDVDVRLARAFINGYMYNMTICWTYNPDGTTARISQGNLGDDALRAMVKDCVKFMCACNLAIHRWTKGESVRTWNHAGRAFGSARNHGAGFTGTPNEWDVRDALNHLALGMGMQTLRLDTDKTLDIYKPPESHTRTYVTDDEMRKSLKI